MLDAQRREAAAYYRRSMWASFGDDKLLHDLRNDEWIQYLHDSLDTVRWFEEGERRHTERPVDSYLNEARCFFSFRISAACDFSFATLAL